MRDNIILVTGLAVTVVAITTLALLLTKAKNHKHINKYLVAVIVFTIISAVIVLTAQYGVKP